MLYWGVDQPLDNAVRRDRYTAGPFEHTTAVRPMSGTESARLMQDKVASITKREITVALGQLVEGGRGLLQARWQLRATLQRDTISSALEAALGAKPALAHDSWSGWTRSGCAPCPRPPSL